MMILRPARLNDIESILALAKSSGPMVYTLPADREALLQKIERSISAFEQDVFCPGEEFYFFVLEDSRNKKLVGTGAINALAGYEAPFYAFRNDTLIHSSRQLNVHSRIHALTLSHDLSDHSQLCSFYVLPNVTESSLVDPSEQDIYRHCLELITLGRLLFMTTYPERFSRDWMAVLPGVFDNNGRAPFWEHVGRKFINLDYHQVEEHHGTQASTFIAELMPHHPLYVPLIAPEAQSVMGQNHPRTERQCHLLSEQGFNSDKYVEIFDAGPIFTAPRHALDIWQKKQSVSLKIKESINNKIKQTHRYLIGITDSQGFRSCFIEGVLQGEQLHVTQEHAHQAHLTQDQSLWCLAL
ncbi:arginine N-succinyltransferase [Vibrio sp. S11_S32]|uniref:arginine N-succinyltransferase n=1 Tax=Vibrio sp. S11_S32 TaxID=2720225 RepID=UPI001681C2E3|nr:arginine N-succinyltransferase [Vibrio sp. S11_S32]MBD1577573.1 arginine N-succinyltransferase [Vibrio sp. S11_S32]